MKIFLLSDKIAMNDNPIHALNYLTLNVTVCHTAAVACLAEIGTPWSNEP